MTDLICFLHEMKPRGVGKVVRLEQANPYIDIDMIHRAAADLRRVINESAIGEKPSDLEKFAYDVLKEFARWYGWEEKSSENHERKE